MKSENNNTALELKKHSALSNIKNELTAVQRKLYNSALFIAGKELKKNPETRLFKVPFSELSKTAGLENETNLSRLKADFKALKKIDIEYNIIEKDKNNVWGIFSLLSYAEINFGSEIVEFEFPLKILNQIVSPDIYALLNLRIINQLNSKYSIALYETFSDIKKLVSYRFEIPMLRKLLGIEDNEYLDFKNFRNRCIIPAVKEINEKTELNISYELEKTGRSVTGITFNIKLKYENLSPLESSAYNVLRSKGISVELSEKFAKELSKENIENALEVLEKAIKNKSVKNATAYLTTILNNSTITTVAPTKTTKANTSTADRTPEPAVDLELNAYLTKRKKVLFTSVSENTITEFINNQNNFTLEHLREKNIIDENNNVIDIKELKKTIIFKGYIENNYYNVELETKQFYSSKQ